MPRKLKKLWKCLDKRATMPGNLVTKLATRLVGYKDRLLSNKLLKLKCGFRWADLPLFWQQISVLYSTIEGLRAKRGAYRFFGWFSFFAGSSWFLADWLVLTWKASFRNFFGRLALRSPEITYAKRLSFAWSGILMSESFEGRFWLLLAALTARFL